MGRHLLFYLVAGLLLLTGVFEQPSAEEITSKVHPPSKMIITGNKQADTPSTIYNRITIFMAGDVMTGRGVDQVLPHPGDPTIQEPYMKSAMGYVKLAEQKHGAIKHPVDFAYIWGEALEELDQVGPDVRLINLETSITQRNDYWKEKGIHYRMNPENIPSLSVAKIDVCSLANNHVLDWGYAGLLETLRSLKKVNIKIAGAGRNLYKAQAPAVIKIKGKGRLIVFAFGLATSGIPIDWAATENRSGVNLLTNLTGDNLRHIQKKVQTVKRKGDIVVASIHWGGNWGYSIPREQTLFAHGLIDEAEVDIVHGHSSHHIKAIEVYNGKLILYGCGDFLNDYEGIGGHEKFRADLALMYFATVDLSSGKLLNLQMTPTQIRRFRVHRATRGDALWLRDTLNREGAKFGTRVKLKTDNRLTLQWE